MLHLDFELAAEEQQHILGAVVQDLLSVVCVLILGNVVFAKRQCFEAGHLQNVESHGLAQVCEQVVDGGPAKQYLVDLLCVEAIVSQTLLLVVHLNGL